MKRTADFTFTHSPADPLVLAPMAGTTDRPFRTLAKRCGAGLVCMEMISANAIKYGNKKTEELIRIDQGEHPVSLQIFGPDPETMAHAAEYLTARYDFDVLDINMGCPMPKIVNNGEGSALMRDPENAGRIVEAVKNATDRPVTVKIRSGFDRDHINAPEIAKICEEAGASAIAVHGRTREQYYTGEADWSVIRSVVSAVSVPVIGNGDIRCAADAVRMKDETGCDYLMIGRGAQGNPWIFSACRAALLENVPPKEADAHAKPDLAELCETMREHIRMQVEEKGETMGILQMRKHIAWYVTGYPNAAALRRDVNAAKTEAEMCRLIDEWASLCIFSHNTPLTY